MPTKKQVLNLILEYRATKEIFTCNPEIEIAFGELEKAVRGKYNIEKWRRLASIEEVLPEISSAYNKLRELL